MIVEQCFQRKGNKVKTINLIHSFFMFIHKDIKVMIGCPKRRLLFHQVSLRLYTGCFGPEIAAGKILKDKTDKTVSMFSKSSVQHSTFNWLSSKNGSMSLISQPGSAQAYLLLHHLQSHHQSQCLHHPLRQNLR